MDFSSFLRTFVIVLHAITTIVVPTASAAPADDDTTSISIADYGFPRCYTSYPNYDTAFVEGSSTTAFIRPLEGHQRFPYEDVVTATSTISTTKEECDALPKALISLGPHWSAIGLTRYEVPTNLTDNDNCPHCLPPKFDQQLIVASHGSWNRDPYIGYNLHAYNIKFDEDNGQYQVQSQSQLLPPLRNSETGIRIRPVDVRTYVGDGALLMTADRDDTYTENSMGGGLYRIRKKTTNEENTNDKGVVNIPLTEVNARGENPGNVVLERLLPISCARQIAPSPNNPQLLYISTFGGFCPDKSAGDKIWVVELEPKNSVVARFAVLIDNLNGPQGIDAFGSSLYIATQGDTTSNQGNCVLEIETVDKYAELVLSGDTTNKPVANAVVCGFTRIQQSHSWRTLRVHPSGEYAVVSIGADCNWPCEDNSANNDLQTTLVRVNLFENRGSVAVIARGIRNAIGLWFDSPDHLLFTSFGSDRAAGIPGATSANNVPDCTVEVLNLGNQTTGNNEEGDAASAVQATGRFGLWLCHIIVASWIVLGYLL